MFQFNINGTVINDMPDGWNDIQSSIKRDDLTGILLYDSEINLKFYAGQDGYSILKAAWDSNQVGESTIDIYQRFPDNHYGLIHSGTIFHSSIRFELINQNLSFRTEDRGFYAMVNNNKKIETALNTGKTKNDVGIGPCPSFTLNVHKISNGTLHFTCQAYKLIDVIRYVVSFMTDNRMTVQSACFDTGGIYEGICVVVGNELISHNQTKHPIISWEKLSNDLVKRLNVQFSIVGSIDNPVMNIDTAADFYGQNNAFSIPTIPNAINLSTDENQLYSMVEVGSEKYDTTSALQFPDVYSLISFRTESFHFKGTNNIDKKLDLVGKCVVSHAVIEIVNEQLSGYDAYADDVFLIQYDTATNNSHQSNWVGTVAPNKHLFNEMFTNQNILNRWTGYLPGEVSNTVINTGAQAFEAHATVPTGGISVYTKANLNVPGYVSDDDTDGGLTLVDDIPFWNDYDLDPYSSNHPQGFDPSNNYGLGIATPQGTPVQFPNMLFTAPVNGFYNFYAEVFTNIYFKTEQAFGPFLQRRWRDKKVGLRFIKRDAAQNILQEFDGPYYNVVWDWDRNGGVGEMDFTLTHSIGTFMNSGELMECNMYHYVRDQHANSDKDYYKLTVKNGYWGCDGINTGGGSVMPSNPDTYKSLKLEFEYPLDLTEYQQILSSKQGMIQIPIDQNKFVNGWIQNIRFEHNSGETKFTLISDGNTVNK